MKKIAIIGGGPAALMLAAKLNTRKYKVTICERNKAVGRKFLVAGDGGLNLTYNSSIEELVSNYHPSDFIAPTIKKFTNQDLIQWCNDHEIPTFVGSSDRVFPDLEMKPIEVLNKITEAVANNKVDLHLETTWIGVNEEGGLIFEEYEDAMFDVVVYAMGGASWKVTGSDGYWAEDFEDLDIEVIPFRAANCAFGVDWNRNFINTHKGKPVKNVALTFQDQVSKGELVITQFGLEGNALYPLSQKIQDALLTESSITVNLDLKPTMTVDQIKEKYKGSELEKTTDILRKDLNIDRAAIGIIKRFSDKEMFLNPDALAEIIKAIPVVLNAADDLDKAISTLGGISLNEIDENFQLKKLPNSYAIGEMLDWYAPTGGYLLQACFSMGYVLAEHLNARVFSEEEE